MEEKGERDRRTLPGKLAANPEEAAGLVIETVEIEEVSDGILSMFMSLSDTEKTRDEADRVIGAAVKRRYGNKASWWADRWFVPIPKLQYDGKNVPQLIVEISTYLVAKVEVRTSAGGRWITVVGAVGKPETLCIPVVFLHALLEEDPGRFAIQSRDSTHTTWEVPGAKPIRLPNDFMAELMELLKRRSVVAWLEEFNFQGRCVALLVAGSLLGLAFQDSSRPVLLNEEMVTTDTLVSALESLAYRPAEAKEMVSRIAPRLRADMTLEEAIRIALQTGKEGDQP